MVFVTTQPVVKKETHQHPAHLYPLALIMLIRFQFQFELKGCNAFKTRLILRVPLRTCSSVLLHELHWLLVEFRIKFKLACLTYKALSTSTPTYKLIHALLTPYIPPRCLRSSSTGLLAEPRCRTVMGSRVFHASAPKEWNRLPISLRSSNSLPSFKKRLKTHYFSLAFKDLEI